MSSNTIEDIYVLSPAQQGILYHSLYNPDARPYFLSLTYILRGAIDLTALRQAFQEVVNRHTSVRTGFLWENVSKPVQVVYRDVEIPFDQEDWRGLASKEQYARLDAYIEQNRQRGFDFACPPLLRLAVFQLADDEYRLVLSHHHLVIDGWSLSLVLGEVLESIRASRRGETAGLAPARPYRDYIGWLQGQNGAAAEAYWRRTLGDFSSPTPLGIDRAAPRAAEPSVLHRRHEIRCSEATTAGLNRSARRHGLTINTILQAAWSILLSRYSGKSDVLFGVTVSGRPAGLAGVEQMIGVFINTLPLRVTVPEHQDAASWMRALQQQQAEMRQYEYTALVDIQGWTAVPRGQPLFESVLVFENFPFDKLPPDGAVSLTLDLPRVVDQTNYPLSFIASPGECLSIQVSYDAARFDPEAISRLGGHLQTLLGALADDLEQRVGELPILPDWERECVLNRWNATATGFPPNTTLDRLLGAQATRTPGAVAVTSDASTLSYAELEERANRLAHYLRAQGIGAEARVGVCLDRSVELVVVLAAILKAGGAYVPLDPNYPAERLRYMLADSGVRMLLTSSTLHGHLPAHALRVEVDRLGAELASLPDTPPSPGAMPGNLAYMIYTSGSTGAPKGVMISHQAICNRLLWLQTLEPLTSEDRILQKTAFSFDASVMEFFAPLIAGATLVLAKPGGHQDPAYLMRTVAEQKITLLQVVPSLLRVLLEVPGLDRCHALRRVICAGEALSGELQERFHARLPGAVLNNLYGPTEAAIDVTAWRCQPEQTGVVPIGRPIANMRAYVLDSHFRPAPIGVTGALYFGGVQLARGYLGKAALTAERFLPDPFGKEPGGRLYWTGDLARWRPDGALEFAGRMDHQVKIRGFRIELGEIEAELLRHPAVGAATVLVRRVSRDGAEAEDSLVAYLVPRVAGDGSNPPVAVSTLRRRLQERLPEYMTPAAFVWLDALPLTPNGKLDRSALPAPDVTRAVLDDAYVPPHSPVEELLVGAWARVLGVERVGINDNFFELGGHSLLATRIISEVRDTFQVELPLRSLVEAPTVSAFARRIAEEADEQREVLPPVLPRGSSGDEAPISFAQERLWFLEQLTPGSSAYTIAVGLRLAGRLDEAALASSLAGLAQRHEALRTRLPMREGRPYAAADPPGQGTFPLAVVDLRAVPAELVEAAARQEVTARAAEPFDLAAGPLARAVLLRLAETEHALLLSFHHSVVDGWSAQILLRDLGALYQSACGHGAAGLPELTVQYGDFAAWQRKWLEGAERARQLAYWKGQLAGAPPVLALPVDRPRPAVQAFRGGQHRLGLGEELTAALRARARSEGATLFMLLLGGFQVLLGRLAGQSEVVVGAPMANRPHASLDEVVGCFVNTLALRSRWDAGETFRALLGRVRETCLGAYAHQDVPFELVVEAADVERSLSYTPVFQVMLALQPTVSAERVRLPGLRVGEWEVERRASQCDLMLTLTDGEQGLVGGLEYDSEIFTGETIGRIAERLETLLAAVAADAERRVGELPILPARERARVVEEWNLTGREYRREVTLHGLVSEQAERTPEAEAVKAEGCRLSYGELEERSNRLAHYLRGRGVGAETRVGVCLERSVELMVGLLGILKAGGVYVPLDPSYPRERLEYMLADAGARVLLTSAELRERAPGEQSLRLEMEQLELELAGQPGTAPAEVAGAGNLAYVIYTSGSSGSPKGVMISHESICNRLQWMQERYGLKRDDSVLQKTSISFDVSVWELFWPLMTGARLVMARPKGQQDPGYLVETIAEEKITTVHFVPSMLGPFVAEAGVGKCGGLRRVVCSGEALSAEVVKRFRGELPGVGLHNLYGPTEAAVDVTAWECGEEWKGDGVPIGRPVANTQIYILDERGEPVPIGVAGELYIGGIQVGRGYMGRAGMTAERFVPDGLGGERGGRLYRTGDLARWRADGEVEYLGRRDEQVKIRGFRVELGEIESELQRCGGVREAAVAAQGQRLVAYLVGAGPRPTQSELRRQLQERLPEYMIPGAVVWLEELPVTPNGKLDRRRLPAPETERPVLDRAYAAPRTPTEALLAEVWSKVLDVHPIGIHDNFFELGGHSLVATRVISQVRESLAIDLPLRSLFEAPTVSTLAAWIDEFTNGRDLDALVSEIENLSDAEVDALLAAERSQHEKGATP